MKNNDEKAQVKKYIIYSRPDSLTTARKVNEIIDQNSAELNDGPRVKPARTLEERYLEFLYFQARLAARASQQDREAVKIIAAAIQEHDDAVMNEESKKRAVERDEKEERIKLGNRIAQRYKKIIDYREIELPGAETLAGTLDAHGLQLRTELFGTGVVAKYIKTWDALLYAIEAAEPKKAAILVPVEGQEDKAKPELERKEVPVTFNLGPNFSDINVLYNRLDNSGTLAMLMDNYVETK